MNINTLVTPTQASLHLEKPIWDQVNRLHLRKIIAEFSHERIIVPQHTADKNNWGHYVLRDKTQEIAYTFRAKILALNHWYIDTNTLEKQINGVIAEVDAISFLIEFQDELGISDESFPVYLEEVCSTLSGSSYLNFYGKPTSADLLTSGYQQTESTMTGHPRFIANNGRIGFDASDYRKYAPETAAPFSLIWLAGHNSTAVFTAISTLAYEQVISQELGAENLQRFNDIFFSKNLNPKEYFFIPVHPWQWFNKLSNIFAADIATLKLVCLGYSDDEYLPQQSIRTFFNVSNPQKFYVKTALSVLNMGYIRGLSPKFMKTNPPINEWIYNLVENDTYLQAKKFLILREIASVSFAHQHYEAAISEDSHYKKMLACLWRESPVSRLKDNQRLITMAALLHIDNNGTAYLPTLIRASGLSTSNWLKAYLDCYLCPLLHCFFKWDMVFMPHGENLIMVLENHIPVRAIMKDIGEEVSLLNTSHPIPDAASRLSVTVPETAKTLPLFTQIFDSIFRFISAILAEHDDFNENEFWKLVADCILDYQQEHPEFNEDYQKYDLFISKFSPDALNKLQLNNNRQLRNRANPFQDLPYIGNMENPIYPYRPETFNQEEVDDQKE
jgi:siderophore synthetase component